MPEKRQPLTWRDRELKDWQHIGDKVKRYKKVHPSARFSYDYVEVAARLKAAGFTDADVAYALNRSPSTIGVWKKKYPQFRKAMEEGKSIAVNYLVAQGMRAAAGYDYTESNEKYTIKTDEDGVEHTVCVGKSVYNKHQSPDAKLLMFLLSNLSPDKWRISHKIDIREDKRVNIQIDGKIVSEQIDKLAGALNDNIKQIEAKVIDIDNEAKN